MKVRAVMLTLLCAATLHAQSVASTAGGVVIAHDRLVELQGEHGWSVEGVANPGPIVVGDTRVAVFDSVKNEARIIELADGKSIRVHTGETPVDGVFIERDLFLVDRDARTLERFGADGSHASIGTAADPSFVRASDGRLYVYARVGGKLHEIDARTMKMLRELDVPPHLSDIEIDARRAYLLDPAGAKIHMVTLSTMKLDSIKVAVVPTDLAIVRSAVAQQLAFADPSAKRVWLMNLPQTESEAFVDAFLRALTGMRGTSAMKRVKDRATGNVHTIAGADRGFPTGVDRVLAHGSEIAAYDSSSRTLYRYGGTSSVIATDVAPNAFAMTPDGIIWYDAVRRLQKIAY